MRTLSLIKLTLVSLAVVASCSKTGTPIDETCLNPPYYCLDDRGGGYCSDILISPLCSENGWSCPPNTIPESECRCPGIAPSPSCKCYSFGWSCPQDGGAADGGGACLANGRFTCLYGDGTFCGDVAILTECVGGQWQCPTGAVPASQCLCAGAPPPGCTCTSAGWACTDGGVGGAGGRGGAGGTDGGTGGRGGAVVDAGVDAVVEAGVDTGVEAGVDGGSPTSCAANPAVCGPSGVCLRKQVLGGACFLPDGGCQAGYSLAGQCCVMDTRLHLRAQAERLHGRADLRLRRPDAVYQRLQLHDAQGRRDRRALCLRPELRKAGAARRRRRRSVELSALPGATVRLFLPRRVRALAVMNP